MVIYESTKPKLNAIQFIQATKSKKILSLLAQIQFTVQKHILGLVHYLTSFIF